VKLTALEPLAVQQAGVAHPQGFNVVGKYVVPIKSDEDVRDSQGRCVVHSVNAARQVHIRLVLVRHWWHRQDRLAGPLRSVCGLLAEA
jgi:hypothetical protein